MRTYASNRAKLRIALGHMRHVIARKAFATWRIRAAELAQHKRRLLGAALLWSRHTQASAFQAWVQHIKCKQAKVQQVEHLCPIMVICSYLIGGRGCFIMQTVYLSSLHTLISAVRPPVKVMSSLGRCFFTLHHFAAHSSMIRSCGAC
jgi:hypothetical protein